MFSLQSDIEAMFKQVKLREKYRKLNLADFFVKDSWLSEAAFSKNERNCLKITFCSHEVNTFCEDNCTTYTSSLQDLVSEQPRLMATPSS